MANENTTGFDINQYNRTLEIAEEIGITVEIAGDYFVISNDNSLYVHVNNVNELFNFITGYEWGKNAGFADGIKQNETVSEGTC